MSKSNIELKGGIKLFTIGFAKKSASEFFSILQKDGVKRVVDIRLNNVSQLAGFTKKDDLAFFLNEIAGIKYLHVPDMAPSKEILDGYKKKNMSWVEYEKKFKIIMRERRIENILKPTELNNTCLLCSEPKPDNCHRRLRTATGLRIFCITIQTVFRYCQINTRKFVNNKVGNNAHSLNIIISIEKIMCIIKNKTCF